MPSPCNKGPYDYKKLSETSPASDYSTMQLILRLGTKNNMIKRVSETSPASDYSSMQIRLHPGTKVHMIIKNLQDFTCIRLLNHASMTSPASDYSTMQVRLHLGRKGHMIINNSPGFHLHPTTHPCKYDFTLEQTTI